MWSGLARRGASNIFLPDEQSNHPAVEDTTAQSDDSFSPPPGSARHKAISRALQDHGTIVVRRTESPRDADEALIADVQAALATLPDLAVASPRSGNNASQGWPAGSSASSSSPSAAGYGSRRSPIAAASPGGAGGGGGGVGTRNSAATPRAQTSGDGSGVASSGKRSTTAALNLEAGDNGPQSSSGAAGPEAGGGGAGGGTGSGPHSTGPVNTSSNPPANGGQNPAANGGQNPPANAGQDRHANGGQNPPEGPSVLAPLSLTDVLESLDDGPSDPPDNPLAPPDGPQTTSLTDTPPNGGDGQSGPQGATTLDPVPEPASMVLLLTGTAAFASRRRRARG